MKLSPFPHTIGWLACGLIVVAAFAPVETDAASRRREPRKPMPRGDAPSTPGIRLTEQNKVPACVSPGGLMQMIEARNPGLDARFKTIATFYKQHGETLGVRWDYAFYQMVLETNYLMFKRGDGKSGDVKPRQNNFAGIGATGGGVPGDSFPDVSTGVLAQMQHLIAYSGEKVSNPVAPRTREQQDGIVSKSKQLGRAVTFGDLTNRWAADRNYARSINVVAERFSDSMCNGRAGEVAANASTTKAPPSAPADDVTADTATGKNRGKRIARKAIEDSKADGTAKTGLGMPPNPATGNVGCDVMAASFGGSVTLLIRAETAKGIAFTALGVEGGAEDSMAENYMKVHAEGGKVLGRFKNRDEAVAHAYNLCDSGKP